jgi:hypothetical protein
MAELYGAKRRMMLSSGGSMDIYDVPWLYDGRVRSYKFSAPSPIFLDITIHESSIRSILNHQMLVLQVEYNNRHRSKYLKVYQDERRLRAPRFH